MHITYIEEIENNKKDIKSNKLPDNIIKILLIKTINYL